MLEATQIPSTWPDVANQCLFDVNRKHSRLNLAPVSFASTFELESDLDICLDLNLSRATNSKEFQMDFSVPTSRMIDFLTPAKRLNVLPEKIDFSKLLSFQSYTHSTSIEPSVADYYNPVDAELKNITHLIPELQKIADKMNENLVTDYILEDPMMLISSEVEDNLVTNDIPEEPKLQIANEIEENPISEETVREPKLQISNAIEENTISEETVREPKLQISNEVEDNHISDNITKELNIQRNFGLLSGLLENRWTQTLKDMFFGDESKKIQLKSQKYTKSIPLKDNSLLKTVEGSDCISDMKNSKKIPGKEINLAIKLDERLELCKHNSLKRFHNIVDVSEILKNGVQIFRKPATLYVLDNLREWKKKGEGQIEIWRLDKSDSKNYYMLLWDKNTEKLLIHMRLDRKWSIDYLADTNNSCRWSHFNYANCPRGVRERLACRFKDSKVTANFLCIVAKCVANSDLH